MADNPRPANGAFQIQLFRPELKHLPSSISSLLSSYSGIPVERQKEHITAVRNRAYKSYPYPCLGRWRFLDLDLASHPLYHTDILPMLKKGSTPEAPDAEKPDWIFLDLGCCLGQDVRKLLFDGADPARIYGADLRPEFIDMGYELFKDEATFPRAEHFIAPADVFDFSTDSELSKKCDGRVRILHSTAVFHLFNWEEQVKMARRCLQLLTSKTGRALICGGQVGNVNAGEFPRRRLGGTRFRHNEESWKRLWEEVMQMERGTHEIKALEVHSIMQERNTDRFREDLEALQSQDGASTAECSNTDQRQIGSIEEGFRWMKWWAWIDFA
jgi:SAM-dependent methyltransferase